MKQRKKYAVLFEAKLNWRENNVCLQIEELEKLKDFDGEWTVMVDDEACKKSENEISMKTKYLNTMIQYSLQLLLSQPSAW